MFQVRSIILDGAEISMEELYDLDMYEIERIDVLKDAQASIVYGDRAANGVIVIERQQVTDSKPRLSYNFVPELSIPDLSSMNLCNAAQKLELERLAGSSTPTSWPSWSRCSPSRRWATWWVTARSTSAG